MLAQALSDCAPHPITGLALSALGFLTVARWFYSFLTYTYLLLKPSKLDRYLYDSRDGKPAWALVTGATSGIGLALSHELARHGFCVVIHGRNKSKLDAVETELRAAHPGREFRQLVADASHVPCTNCLSVQEQGTARNVSSFVDFDSIVKQLSHLHLTVLISNAGNGPTPTYGTLESYSQSMITSTVSLNALFPLHLVARLLPTIDGNSPSLIIQIGSMSANFLPLLASYSSSKAFIRGVFGCVAREMRLTNRTGVEMILMRVGRVTGVQHEDGQPSWTMPDAKVFAKAALGWVGSGRSEVIPWWGHAFQQAFLVEVMPDWLRERVFLRVMRGLWEEQRAKEKQQCRSRFGFW